jgi:hypothetical protein
MNEFITEILKSLVTVGRNNKRRDDELLVLLHGSIKKIRLCCSLMSIADKVLDASCSAG